jgi:hypothetical protein
LFASHTVCVSLIGEAKKVKVSLVKVMYAFYLRGESLRKKGGSLYSLSLSLALFTILITDIFLLSNYYNITNTNQKKKYSFYLWLPNTTSLSMNEGTENKEDYIEKWCI